MVKVTETGFGRSAKSTRSRCPVGEFGCEGFGPNGGVCESCADVVAHKAATEELWRSWDEGETDTVLRACEVGGGECRRYLVARERDLYPVCEACRREFAVPRTWAARAPGPLERLAGRLATALGLPTPQPDEVAAGFYRWLARFGTEDGFEVWRYGDECPRCEGEGCGRGGTEDCFRCKGLGAVDLLGVKAQLARLGRQRVLTQLEPISPGRLWAFEEAARGVRDVFVRR